MLLQGCFAAEDTATLFALVSDQTFSADREWRRGCRGAGRFRSRGVGVSDGSWGRGSVVGTGTGPGRREGWPMLSGDKTRTGEPFGSRVCSRPLCRKPVAAAIVSLGQFTVF